MGSLKREMVQLAHFGKAARRASRLFNRTCVPLLVAFCIALWPASGWTDDSATPLSRRHFRLAMSKDDGICEPLLRFYNEIGQAILSRYDESWEEDRNSRLLSLGFTAPKSLNDSMYSVALISWQAGAFSTRGKFVEADIFNDGRSRLVAIGNSQSVSGKIQAGFADVYRMPAPIDMATEKARLEFFSKPELRVLPGDYSDPPNNLVWKPIDSFGYTLSDQPGIGEIKNSMRMLSEATSLTLIARAGRYYWIERERSINSEVRLFSLLPPEEVVTPDLEQVAKRKVSRNSDLCYISPNIKE